jgi:hypothetical protein
MARRKRRSSSRSSRKRRRPGGIQINPANKGKLRKAAKAKRGKKIPISTLRRLKKSKNPKTRQRANFALNARTKFKNRGRRRKRRR